MFLTITCHRPLLLWPAEVALTIGKRCQSQGEVKFTLILICEKNLLLRAVLGWQAAMH
jgi:hypothetical protein